MNALELGSLGNLGNKKEETKMTPLKTEDFQKVVDQVFNKAKEDGLKYVDILSGDLHRMVGGYPGPDHRMPTCINVMKQKYAAD